MMKIPTIYERDPATNRRHVMNVPHPECGWVFAGEGRPTYKWDAHDRQVSEDLQSNDPNYRGEPEALNCPPVEAKAQADG